MLEEDWSIMEEGKIRFAVSDRDGRVKMRDRFVNSPISDRISRIQAETARERKFRQKK